MTADRLPLIMFVAIGLVVVAVIGVATGSWIAMAIAMAVHLIGSAIVFGGSLKAVWTGTQAGEESQRLDEKAGEATGSGYRDVETEIEALKREPSSR